MDVLIVDDSDVILRWLEIVLAHRGCRVTCASNGEEALALLRERHYPLLLLDWQMPGMNGPQVIRQLREMASGEAVYVLMITARSDVEALREALDAGANDYLIKPLEQETLDLRLTIAESQAVMMQERRQHRLQREESLQRLARSHEDLSAILNQVCIGTVLCDGEGQVSFISMAAATILELEPERCLGRHWTTVLPFKPDDLARLQAVAQQPLLQRQRLGLHLRSGSGRYYWMDVMVRDDPRDPAARLFSFLDMTEVHSLRQRLNESTQFQDIVGRSRPMMLLYQQIREISAADITVLVDGETGTGKEIVARAVHASSPRAEGPFIAVNCAGFTDSLLTSQLFGHIRGAFTGALKEQKGVFEEAHGGTLFLDEIGEIPMNVQTALLRVLQQREIVRVGENLPRAVDVRVIAATNRDLEQEVEAGRFRADLMYRIRVAQLRLPPLRERIEDIPLLVNVFIARHRASSGKDIAEIANDALRTLTEHHWPGNVRERENAIEVAAVRCRGRVIQHQDLPPYLSRPVAPAMLEKERIDGSRDTDGERERLVQALAQAGGKRKEAARLLGISRATFYRRLEQYGIGK